jgi:putative ABC transport system permease protein
MFRNYLAAALRNLVRNRLYTAINIIGLTVAFAAALLIALFVRDERSYDRWIPGHEGTYIIRQEGKPSPDLPAIIRDNSPVQFADWLTASFPEIERVARLGFAQNGTPSFKTGIRHGEIEGNEILFWADPNFLSVVALPVIAGDPATALEQPDSIVLTRRMARKYFGRDDPIGETLELDRQHPMRVTAVLKDLPSNTHLNFDFLASSMASFSNLKRNQDRATSKGNFLADGYTYFRLSPGADIKTVIAALPALLDRYGYNVEQRKKGLAEVAILPVADLHLSQGNDNNYLMKPRGNPALNTALSIIAVLLIVIAGINFVNLMTARAMRRAVEVGIRKVSGATRRQLAVQFLGESAIYVAIGLVFAAGAVQSLLPAFNAALQRTSIAFNFWQEPEFAGAIVGIGIGISLLAGIYPAMVLPSFMPAAVLKSGPSQSIGSGAVRRMLVVFQFAILIGLVLFTLAIYRQSNFAFAQRLRLESDQVLLVRTNCTPAFKDEVSRLPGVRAVACSGTDALSYEWIGWDLQRTDGASLLVDQATVDPSFFSFYGLRPIAGRVFDAPSDGPSPSRLVLNETAARQLGFKSAQDAVGKNIPCGEPPGFDCSAYYGWPAAGAEVVGVVPDFAVDAVHDAVHPVAYIFNPRKSQALYGFEFLSVKLSGSQIPETLEAIDRLWKQFGEPKAIVRTFLDSRVQDVYLDITRQSVFFTAFSGIAVFISCLGLFGLSAFAAETRTKEIGIRKSMGATRRDILRLLLWQFAKPVLLGNVIAWPIAYYFMRRWLQGFAYHIDLAPWMFLAASGLALAIALATVIGHALLVARSRPATALRYE